MIDLNAQRLRIEPDAARGLEIPWADIVSISAYSLGLMEGRSVTLLEFAAHSGKVLEITSAMPEWAATITMLRQLLPDSLQELDLLLQLTPEDETLEIYAT